MIAGAVVDEAAGDCWGGGLSLWLLSPTVAASVASLSAARRFVLCYSDYFGHQMATFPFTTAQICFSLSRDNPKN